MLIILSVIIDVHFDLLDVGVLIRRPGKRIEFRFIDGIEPSLSRAFELFKGLVIHLYQQGLDAGV